MSSGLENRSRSSLEDMSMSAPPPPPPAPSAAVFGGPSSLASPEAAPRAASGAPSPFAASAAGAAAAEAGAGKAAGLSSAGTAGTASAITGLAAVFEADAPAAAPPAATTPSKHPPRGMWVPSEYKCSFNAGRSSPQGSTYSAKVPSRRTTPALIFERKYLAYSSRANCSCMACAASETTVPCDARRHASSKGTRWVMSNTFWLPAADRRHTSTSWTLPCSSCARVDSRLPMFLASVKTPVQTGTPAGGGLGATGAISPSAIAVPGAVATPPAAPPSVWPNSETMPLLPAC
mmetsp:Transcript_104344/g.300328  ORF Transcript_104344/g.300328 Transcript_104344/m.300328 type:complete len:291 (+) Transcript_104344:100-972(+)